MRIRRRSPRTRCSDKSVSSSPRVALVTTEGFRDVIEIGAPESQRDLRSVRRAPTSAGCARGPPWRARAIDHRGNVLVPLEQSAIERRVPPSVNGKASQRLRSRFCTRTRTMRTRRRMARALRRRVAAAADHACRAEVDPEYREYERYSTTVVNARAAPIVSATSSGWSSR